MTDHRRNPSPAAGRSRWPGADRGDVDLADGDSRGSATSCERSGRCRRVGVDLGRFSYAGATPAAFVLQTGDADDRPSANRDLSRPQPVTREVIDMPGSTAVSAARPGRPGRRSILTPPCCRCTILTRARKGSP
jgi:hypothetical protein